MRRWEAVGGVGPTFFFGDIGGFSRTKNILGLRDMSYLQTRFGVNGNLKYRLSREVNLRLSLTYTLLHATDIRGSNEGRFLEATTSAFEPAILGEYYFIKNQAENSYLFTRRRMNFVRQLIKSLDFYAFGGLGGVLFNVNGNNDLKQQWALKPELKDGGIAAIIPAGLGTTLIYSPNLNFGLEVGGRYAFTDYLDGYTSQYSKANDVYYFLNFTVTYKLKTGPHGFPSFR